MNTTRGDFTLSIIENLDNHFRGLMWTRPDGDGFWFRSGSASGFFPGSTHRIVEPAQVGSMFHTSIGPDEFQVFIQKINRRTVRAGNRDADFSDLFPI